MGQTIVAQFPLDAHKRNQRLPWLLTLTLGFRIALHQQNNTKLDVSHKNLAVHCLLYFYFICCQFCKMQPLRETSIFQIKPVSGLFISEYVLHPAMANGVRIRHSAILSKLISVYLIVVLLPALFPCSSPAT